MKNLQKTVATGKKVEVMALFNYSHLPCQPLYFRKQGQDEVEITETLNERIKFVGDSAKHIFRCLAGKTLYRLEFDAKSLGWMLYEG